MINGYFDFFQEGIVWNYDTKKSSKEVPQNGSFEIKYPFCRLLGFLQDGKKNGYWSIRWNKGGFQEETGTEGEYKDGKKHGKWRYREYSLYHYLQYRVIAPLMSEGEYIDGKKDGKWVYYRRDLYSQGDSFDTEIFRPFKYDTNQFGDESDVFRFIKIYDNGELKKSFYECKKGKILKAGEAVA